MHRHRRESAEHGRFRPVLRAEDVIEVLDRGEAEADQHGQDDGVDRPAQVFVPQHDAGDDQELAELFGDRRFQECDRGGVQPNAFNTCNLRCVKRGDAGDRDCHAESEAEGDPDQLAQMAPGLVDAEIDQQRSRGRDRGRRRCDTPGQAVQRHHACLSSADG